MARLTNGDQKGWMVNILTITMVMMLRLMMVMVMTTQTCICRGSDGQMTSGRQNQTFVVNSVKVVRQRMEYQGGSDVRRLINRAFVHYPS